MLKRHLRLHLITSLFVLAILSFGISYSLGAIQPGELDSRNRASSFSGQSVTRIFASQSDTNGATDWSKIDEAIQVAKRGRVRVVLVLEKAHDEEWYARGYRTRQENSILTYTEYVKAIVSRYKDEPTVSGWMLTSGPDLSANEEFSRNIGTIIRTIDSTHLILDANERAL